MLPSISPWSCQSTEDPGGHRVVGNSVFKHRPRLSTGRDWSTDFHQFILDTDYSIPEGYTVGDLWG